MKESTEKLLKLINESYTLDEISQILNISYKQIFNRLYLLKGKGYNFIPKYYYDGNITYTPKNIYHQKEEISIITPYDKTHIKFLVISDPHLGSVHESLDNINLMYNYCLDKNIHLVILGGDLIHGQIGASRGIRIENISEQIDYFLKNYPQTEKILTFAILGDHDISAFKKNNQDFDLVLKNNRHDIISLGYGLGKLKIKSDEILINHTTSNKNNLKKLNQNTGKIILNGHTHTSKLFYDTNNLIINIPTISTLAYNEANPGAIILNLGFEKGIIVNVLLENLIIIDAKIYKANTTEIFLNRKIIDPIINSLNNINYEEATLKPKIKKLKK